MHTDKMRLCIIIAGIILSMAVPVPADENGAMTATRFDGMNLDNASPDPETTRAGEALALGIAPDVIGTAAPAAVMKTIDGQQIDLSAIYGRKPVYLKFWATWCIPCRQQMPAFEEIYRTLGDRIQVVAIDIGYSDDEASVRAFREKLGLTLPIVMDDGSLAKGFHLTVTPQHVLIGKDGRFKYIGHADNEALAEALKQALQEEADPAEPAPERLEHEKVIQVGEKVPDLSVATLQNGSLPLKAESGHLLAVQFFSTWCEWYLESSRPDTSQACTRVREAIETMKSTVPEVDWIGIAGGPWTTKEDLAEYGKNYQVTIPLALDEGGELNRRFGIQEIPTVALIDDTQRLIELIAPAEKDLQGAIQKALGKAADNH